MTVLALRPLSETVANTEANRGRYVDLNPHECDTVIAIANRCIVGESIGIVVGLEDVEDPTCCIDDGFVHTMIRGHVTWGLGCVKFDAWFDWQNGAQLTIVAEQVKVDAHYIVVTAPWAPDDLPCLPPLRVSAGFGYGCIGKGARLTEVAQVETVGGSVLIDVPPFATHVTVQPACGQTAEIRLFDCGKAYAPCFTFTGGGPDAVEGSGIGQQIPIPNGVRFVEVFNRNASGPLTAFVIFGLGL